MIIHRCLYEDDMASQVEDFIISELIRCCRSIAKPPQIFILSEIEYKYNYKEGSSYSFIGFSLVKED